MQPQARAQKWSAETYDAHARFVSDLASEVMAWLDPKAGERILDLGCGDGVLTAELAARGADVLGIDISEDLLRASARRGVAVMHMSGEALAFESEFDAVFSNAALHWMPNASAVVAGVWRALKPGGRFAAEFGGHGNVAAIATALRAVAQIRGGDKSLAAPWFYPTPTEYRDLLAVAGFTVRRIGLFPRPTPL
ncbi:MAG: class I SAM-dependent methyltransferase, partial [Aestuariivirga sp.]